jgi:hypothetical protein
MVPRATPAPIIAAAVAAVMTTYLLMASLLGSIYFVGW